MGNVPEMKENEKKLLSILGKSPDLSGKELLTHTNYKWIGTIHRKLEHLKKQGMIRGLLYYIDHGKLCRNPLHMVFCILESNQSFEKVVSYLRLIEPLSWVYPVLSSYRAVLNVGFISSNDAEMKALLQLLKDNDIISNYIVRGYRSKRVAENPDFFGDPLPPLDNLLNPCEIPDISPGHHDTEWNECDMRILPYLETGYKDGNLIEILRAEKKLHKALTYEQVKYSHKKMVMNKLIEKKYLIFPFPRDQNAVFILFLKSKDVGLTQKMLYNFGRGARLYKRYVLCEDWGMLTCFCHPLFLTDLMYKLDSIEEITKKELYQLRSLSGNLPIGLPCELKYYDFENQILKYPYPVYKEKIKEKLDSEPDSL